VFYGGEPIQDQVNKLKGLKPPHIIVGTPGRIKHLVNKKDLDLSALKIFVLDECDKMLEETGTQISKNTRLNNSNIIKLIKYD
jgi:ATP-dependent RNA helicase UAP56/SUB2